MATSLERLLASYRITRGELTRTMGFTHEDNVNSSWNDKFAGIRRVTPDEIELIRSALRKLKLPDTFELEAVKYVIV